MTATMIDPRDGQPMIPVESMIPGRIYHETQREQQLDAMYKDMCNVASLRGLWIDATMISPTRDVVGGDGWALFHGLRLANGSTTPEILPALINATSRDDAMAQARAIAGDGCEVAVYIPSVG